MLIFVIKKNTGTISDEFPEVDRSCLLRLEIFHESSCHKLFRFVDFDKTCQDFFVFFVVIFGDAFQEHRESVRILSYCEPAASGDVDGSNMDSRMFNQKLVQ